MATQKEMLELLLAKVTAQDEEIAKLKGEPTEKPVSKENIPSVVGLVIDEKKGMFTYTGLIEVTKRHRNSPKNKDGSAKPSSGTYAKYGMAKGTGVEGKDGSYYFGGCDLNVLDPK